MVSSSGSSNSGLKIFKHVRYEHLIAGFAGGVTSTVILHPLDLIKIRLAVSDGRPNIPQYKGIRRSLYTIKKQEGFKGLYKGLTPNVLGSASAWGLYFLFYSTIKAWIQDGDTKTPLGPTLHMIAASEAGIMTMVLTNPVWVVRTRLCLQYDRDKQYSGMVDALSKIYRVEGMRGLYKGFLPSLFGVSHSALHFMAFEEMRNFYNLRYRSLPIDAKLGTSEFLFIVTVSRSMATILTYPLQVMRARLQDQRGEYTSTLDCMKRTWRFEGFQGFYKGLTPNLTRLVPSTMLTFTVYENLSRYLLKRRYNY